MPRCPYCPPDPVTGKRQVHRSIRRDCPTFAEMKRRRKLEAETEAPAPAPAGPAPAAPAAPAPEKPKKKRAFAFLARASTAVQRGAQEGVDRQAKPVEEFDWELSDEVHSRFWIAIVGFSRAALNLINVQVLGISELPPELLRLGKADLDALNDGFKGPTSKFLYKAGFKSLEAATRFVNSLTMISTFGLQGVNVAIWYIKNVPNSPKLKAWRERQKQKIAELRKRTLSEKQKEEAIDTTAQEVPK